jgi:hypothetical protein
VSWGDVDEKPTNFVLGYAGDEPFAWKIWWGTEEQFLAITEPDPATIYFRPPVEGEDDEGVSIEDVDGLEAALDAKVDENAAITGATKTKISYDSKGLVTAGADATTADIADSTNKRYVTDAQLTVIGNTSGTNTGDQTSVSGNAGTATALQNSRTVQTNLASTSSASFNGTANITPGVTGTLPVANGGTGAATLTGIVKGSGTSALAAATAGTDYVAPGGALGTPSSGTLTNCTGLPASGLTASTSTAVGVGTVELGHATDTTLSRSAAGQLAVEGKDVAFKDATINTQTGTTYTPAATDDGKVITLDNASSITVTVPQNSDAAIPVGAYIEFIQLGAGQVTFAAGTGATLNSRGTALKIAGQYGTAALRKTATNTFILAGDLTT